MLNLLSLDVETGGLDPAKHSLLEVGLVAYVDGKVTGTLQLYIQEEVYVVTPKAMEVNGLDLAKVAREGVPPQQAAMAIIEFINEHFGFGNDKHVLIGHNLLLDKYMLKVLFDKAGMTMDNFISYRYIDTMGLIWSARDIGLLPLDFSSGLQGTAKYLGVHEEGTEHTAVGDALTTIRVYEKLKPIFGGQSA